MTRTQHKSYKIVRLFKDDWNRKRTIKKGLTLAAAQKHCKDPQTSSSTATGPIAKRYKSEWFDAYTDC